MGETTAPTECEPVRLAALELALGLLEVLPPEATAAEVAAVQELRAVATAGVQARAAARLAQPRLLVVETVG